VSTTQDACRKMNFPRGSAWIPQGEFVYLCCQVAGVARIQIKKIKVMTVVESLNRLEQTFKKFHAKTTGDTDPGYVWWERINECQKWCNKENTFVQMSDSQTLKVMRSWVQQQKQLKK